MPDKPGSWMEKKRAKAKHAEAMKKIEEEFVGKIQEKWGDTLTGGELDANTGERGEFAEGVLKQLALIPIERARKVADKKRREISDKLSIKQIRAKLTTIGEDFRTEAKVMSDVMRAYFDKLTQYKHHGKIDAEIIARMKDKKSAVNIGKMADALILTQGGEMKGLEGLKGIRDALRFSLGVITLSDTNFKKAKEGIKEAIEKGNEQVKAFGWMAVTFMDTKHKMLFAKDYSKGLGEKGVKKFIKEASAAGALSYLEIEEVIGKGKYKSLFSKEEKKGHEALYKVQHDFAEEAKYLMSESYGANNQTGNMLTFKNVFLSVLMGGGIFSAAFSTGLGLFNGGKMGSAEQTVGAIVNVQNGLKLGTAWGAYELMKKSKEETGLANVTETPDAEKEARDDMKKKITPTWNELFELEGYKGASAFGDWSAHAFSTRKGDVLNGYLTLSNFKFWMKVQKRDDYSKIAAKIEGDEINGEKVKDEDVKILAAAFRTLKISSAGAKRTYPEATKIDA